VTHQRVQEISVLGQHLSGLFSDNPGKFLEPAGTSSAENRGRLLIFFTYQDIVMNEETKREIYRRFGGIPRKTLGKAGSNIPIVSVQELVRELSLKFNRTSKQGEPLSSVLVIYDDQRVFWSAIQQLTTSQGTPSPLIFTDCAQLDHTLPPPNVAPAFTYPSRALFVFDNFQSVPVELDRKLDFVHWGDGDRDPQIPKRSLMILGVHRPSIQGRFGDCISPTVRTRCSTVKLISTRGIGALRARIKAR
jgi:hypothetical protein